MNESKVEKIIEKRKKWSIAAPLVVTALFCYMMFQGEIKNVVPVLIFIAVFDAFFIWLYIVNRSNLPLPKPSYRKLNKIFYLYMMKVLFVLSIITFLLNLKRFLNPFENYKQPGNPSHSDYAVEAVVGGLGGAYVAGRNIKAAEVVEEYYKQKETNINKSQTGNLN